MSDHRTIEAEMELYIRGQLLFDEVSELGYRDQLLLDGLVDSLGATRLMAWVESNWNIEIPAQDVTVENFGTIQDLADYVRSRSTGD